MPTADDAHGSASLLRDQPRMAVALRCLTGRALPVGIRQCQSLLQGPAEGFRCVFQAAEPQLTEEGTLGRPDAPDVKARGVSGHLVTVAARLVSQPATSRASGRLLRRRAGVDERLHAARVDDIGEAVCGHEIGGHLAAIARPQ